MAERDNFFPWHDYQFGVVWGPLVLTRTMSDQRYGVWLTVHGRDEAVEIRCTPRGRRLRVGKVRATHPMERERWKREVGDG